MNQTNHAKSQDEKSKEVDDVQAACNKKANTLLKLLK